MLGKSIYKNLPAVILIVGIIGVVIHLQGCGNAVGITRGDAAAIIMKDCNFSGNTTININDVEASHKNHSEILACVSRKIFGEPAVENYNFRPDDILTQYELAKLSVYLYAALLCVEDENIAPGGRREIPNIENLSTEKKWYIYCAAENGFISTRNFNPGAIVNKSGLRKCIKAVMKKAGITGTDYETYSTSKLANFRSFPSPDIPKAEKLDVFNITKNDRGIVLLAATLQGLANRDTIRLYVDRRGSYDWMAQYAIERGYFTGRETAIATDDWGALLKRYSSHVRKAIVWDTDKRFSINFCVNIAAVEDRVMLTDTMVEIAKQIIPDLEVVHFSDYKINNQLEAQRYNYKNEFPHLRRDVIGWNYYPVSYSRDYTIQMKMPTLWVPGRFSPEYQEETLNEACEILHRFPPAIPMLGFGHAWDVIDGKEGNYGLDEFPAVKLHGEYGKFTGVFGTVGNLSFHSPLRIDPERMKFNRTDPKPITYDSSKKYVAVTMTESGDAPDYIQYGLRPRQWDDTIRGTIPFSMCYGLLNYDIHPLLTEYFASTQSSKDYMFGAISGLGYNYPLLGFGSKGVIDDDGILYMDQEMIMKDHYIKTNDLSKKLNFKSLGIYSFPSTKWSKDNYRDFDRWVAQYMPFIKSFVGDMHRPEKSLLSKDELYARTAYGQNIFHCSTFWYIGKKTSEEELVEYLANEIIKHTTYKGELYHCMAYSWHYGPRRIKMAMEKIIKKHPEYVFVTFDQLDLLQEQRK